MRHLGSIHRHEVLLANDAFADGVCHAIDELREIAKAERLGGQPDEAAAADRLADRLEKNLFAPAEAKVDG